LLGDSISTDYLNVAEIRSIPASSSNQDSPYCEAIAIFGHALDRLACAYEADPDTRRDLMQDIHLALWRSFANFDGRCSLRTWVYRVAHNAAASHVMRQHRMKKRNFVTLDELENLPDQAQETADIAADRGKALERLSLLIQRLDPLDRQVMVLYLEGMQADIISEITGICVGNVPMKIHRIKNILGRRLYQGANHGK
jgi:RNA polymerase sigma-70 factor (ECF subfamily)